MAFKVWTALLCLSLPAFAARPSVTWTAINVNETNLQADAHLLEFTEGKRIMIDVGNDTPTLVAALKKWGVDVIHQILITHPHKDHYAGLKRLLDSTVKIGEVFLNLPDRAICDREMPWGCDFAHVSNTVASLRDRGVPVRPVTPGAVLHLGTDTKLEVLYAYDGLHSPIGPTDINDMSALVRLTVGKQRTLFTGDLNQPLGDYFCKAPPAEKASVTAEILKVPHHGTDSLAPNCFFDTVGMKRAVVPSPVTLWNSVRSSRAREYFAVNKIPTYVNGIQGEIRISYFADHYEISSERP